MGRLYLRGVPVVDLAIKFGVNWSTINYHITKNIRPAWVASLNNDLSIELAKVAQLERVAWEKFESSADPQTKLQIKKELAEEGVDKKLAERVVAKTKTTETRLHNKAWLEIIQWCIEFRAKVYGHFAPEKHKHTIETEFRVAGMSRETLDAQMQERLAQRMAEMVNPKGN